jgi:hypothetical protein
MYETIILGTDVVARANLRVLRGVFAEFSEDDVQFVRDGFTIRKDSPAYKVWEGLQAQLNDYPVLDDCALSAEEAEDIEEALRWWVLRDFAWCIEHKFDIDFDGDIRQLFDEACKASGEFPQHTGNEVIVNLDRIVAVVTEDMVKRFN